MASDLEFWKIINGTITGTKLYHCHYFSHKAGKHMDRTRRHYCKWQSQAQTLF